MGDERTPFSPEFLKTIEAAQNAQEKLGLPRSFIMALIDEEDWGFIIKLHAVIEAAIERSVLERCFTKGFGRKDERVEKIAARLSFDGRVSKLAFAEAFGLLTSTSVAFCRALNQMRNQYAHKISNLSKSITEAAIETGQAENTLKSLYIINTDDNPPSDAKQRRAYIAIAAMHVLWEIEFLSTPPPSLLRGLLAIPFESLEQEDTATPRGE